MDKYSPVVWYGNPPTNIFVKVVSFCVIDGAAIFIDRKENTRSKRKLKCVNNKKNFKNTITSYTIFIRVDFLIFQYHLNTITFLQYNLNVF